MSIDESPPASGALWARTAVVAIVAAAINAVLAVVLADVLATDATFEPLTPVSTGMFTVIGIVIGAVALQLMGGRASAPRRLWTRVAVIATAVSLVPNIVLALAPDLPPAGAPQEGGTPADWLVLAAMHLVAAAIAIPVLARAPGRPPSSR